MKNFLSAINCKQQIPDGSSPRMDLLCWDTADNPEWGALHALGIVSQHLLQRQNLYRTEVPGFGATHELIAHNLQVMQQMR